MGNFHVVYKLLNNFSSPKIDNKLMYVYYALKLINSINWNN